MTDIGSELCGSDPLVKFIVNVPQLSSRVGFITTLGVGCIITVSVIVLSHPSSVVTVSVIIYVLSIMPVFSGK